MRFLGYSIVAAVILFHSAGCSWFGLKGDGAVVAVVGGEEITREMVALRAKALQGNPQAAANPKALAMAQIVHGYVSAQIVNRYGDLVSAASTRAFWASQKPPPAVRTATANQSEALVMRALAKPDHGSWMLEALFFGRPDVQPKQAEQAARLHAELVADPAAIDKVAARERLALDRVWIGDGSIRPAAPDAGTPSYTKEEKQEAGELYRALANVNAGEFFPHPLNTPNAFRLFRVERRTRNELLLAAITIPKLGLDAWFLSQAASIDVELRDRELGKAFLQQAPWGRRLKIKNTDDYPEFFFPSGK